MVYGLYNMIQDFSIISLLCICVYSDKTLVVQFTPKAANNKRMKAVSLTLICFFPFLLVKSTQRSVTDEKPSVIQDSVYLLMALLSPKGS